jgi:hypothetical protein
MCPSSCFAHTRDDSLTVFCFRLLRCFRVDGRDSDVSFFSFFFFRVFLGFLASSLLLPSLPRGRELTRRKNSRVVIVSMNRAIVRMEDVYLVRTYFLAPIYICWRAAFSTSQRCETLCHSCTRLLTRLISFIIANIFFFVFLLSFFLSSRRGSSHLAVMCPRFFFYARKVRACVTLPSRILFQGSVS